MKIGLYFGTFNPIHIGHLIIANHFVEYTDLDEVWFVITPHNPFKKKASLLENHHRLEMVFKALKDYSKLKSSDIEFKLPQPNYTSDTLAYIQENYPKKNFHLIIGEDNLNSFYKWKNYQYILNHHELYVYPRFFDKKQILNPIYSNPKVHLIEQAPVIDISSSAIRKAIKDKKNCKPLLNEKVWDYIDKMNFYK